MLDILNSIINVFTSVVNFIVAFFKDVVFIAVTIGNFIAKASSFLGFLPLSVIAIFLVGLSVVVIYKVAGRD